MNDSPKEVKITMKKLFNGDDDEKQNGEGNGESISNNGFGDLGDIPIDPDITGIDIPEEEDDKDEEDLTDVFGGPGGKVKVPKPNRAF